MASTSKSHFEILSRSGGKSRWDLIEVLDERKAASARAEELWVSKRFSGLKVVKESYDSVTRSYNSLEIFSRGASRKVSKYDESGKVAPCLSPDQLYLPAGRSSIRELLSQSLDEWNLTPTELLHSLDHYNRLNDSGTRLQNAVQRAAIAQSDGSSVQERMRHLYRVIDQTIAIAKQTAQDLPSLESGRLKPLIKAFGEEKNRGFMLSIAVTRYLRPAVTLEDKFGRVVALLNVKHPRWVISALDQFLAEFLAMKKLLPAMFGPQKDRRAFMVLLAEFQAGCLDVKRKSMGIHQLMPDLLRLDVFLGEDRLPLTREALLERLREEISSSAPVCDGDLADKLMGLKEINQIITRVDLDSATREALKEALNDRSSRMVNSQSIGEFLQGFKFPDAKVRGLINVVNSSIGKTAQRTAGNFIVPVLDTPDNEAWFLAIGSNPVERLKLLSAIGKEVENSLLLDMHKRHVITQLDKFSRIIAKKTNLLKKVLSVEEDVIAKVERLLGMMADGYFPLGSVHNEAEQKVRSLMSHPDFMYALATGFGQPNAADALRDFRAKLVLAGISE